MHRTSRNTETHPELEVLRRASAPWLRRHPVAGSVLGALATAALAMVYLHLFVTKTDGINDVVCKYRTDETGGRPAHCPPLPEHGLTKSAAELKSTAKELKEAAAKLEKVPVAPPRDVETLPRRVVYEGQLERFLIAANDGDEEYLKYLAERKFRISPDDVCKAADSMAGRSGVLSLPEEAIKIFAQSVERGIRCASNSSLVQGAVSHSSVALHILRESLDQTTGPIKQDRADRREGGCDWRNAESYWPRTVQLIEAIRAQQAIEDDFLVEAKAWVALFTQLERAQRKHYIMACVNHAFNRNHRPFLELFYFSKMCVGVKAALIVDRALSGLGHLESISKDVETRQLKAKRTEVEKGIYEYCDNAVHGTDFAANLRLYRESLERWLQ